MIVPLCIVLPQIDGYIKYFENGSKKIPFIIKERDKDLYGRYSGNWKKIVKIMKVEFTTDPIYDAKFISVKLKTFGEQNNTVFTDNNDTVVKIPSEGIKYSCIPVIDVDSVYKVEDYKDVKVYLQIYLRQCKYRLKKLRFKNYVNSVLVDSDEEL